jgi:hypothetical protein
VATALNGLPKHVVSTTLIDPTWQNTTVISSDALDAVSALKEKPGRVYWSRSPRSCFYSPAATRNHSLTSCSG